MQAQESTDTNVAASPGEPGVEHPHGRGHVKQTPAAAAHGQETAASHKPERTESSSGSEPGSGKSRSAEHPAHPDPPRDAGNLLPAPCRRTRVQVATRQAIQVGLTAAPRPRPGSVLNPRISTVVGCRWFGPRQMGRKVNRVERLTVALHGSFLSSRATQAGCGCRVCPNERRRRCPPF
jgi:hypothetical protein